jgi:hypothetical protein
MPDIRLAAPAKSHLLVVVRSLLASGWVLDTVPEGGALVRNGQKVMLKSDRVDLRFRLFVYKVTGSSRGRPEERRIEITSTYQKGLPRLEKFLDIVLGYDPTTDLYVGVDPQRIKHGGPTGNASSFFDKEGLTKQDRISVLQRKAALFVKGIEYHAFFDAKRLPEYFFNLDEIHSGTYLGDGPFSGKSRAARRAVSLEVPEEAAHGDVLVLTAPQYTRRDRAPKVSKSTIEAFEKGVTPRKKRKITPEELLKIKLVMEENGRLGEEHVLNAERKRLKKANRADLAARVRWVSQESVAEGYDIISFEDTGVERFIEVKATAGKQNTFEMSDNEWKEACRLGERYLICRVTNVRDDPSKTYIRNPRQLEIEGKVQKTTTGWRVTYRP